MTVKLHCTATTDLLLVSATAKTLLGALGKSADEPGIIEPKDMPAALQALKSLDDARPGAQNVEDTSFQDEAVGMRQHAWPLIQMIERAQAAGKPIVWGTT